jgi:DNA polymerase-1
MEKRGVLLDRGHCEKAKADDDRKRNVTLLDLNKVIPGFVDSSKCLAPYFESHGVTLPLTEKGNPQISDSVLSGISDPNGVALSVLMLRDAVKRSNTYWSNYLYLCDDEGVLHPDFFQAGTVTGRLSCREPNLQNIPKEDQSVHQIRRAFVPRPGFFFLSIDYKQMEFRLMLDYAKQEDLIERIKQGHDPHVATAELTGLPRKAAKTLNFGLLYGMGVAKLAVALGCSEAEARSFKYRYFDALPKVQKFIRDAADRMEQRGYTFNWAGRRYLLDDRKWSYKAANAIIQGGCADVCKVAMVRLHDYLEKKQTKMVLQIHDEILFEVHESDLKVGVPQRLQEIMETAYEAKSLPLTCSASYSTKSFGDLVELNSMKEIAL